MSGGPPPRDPFPLDATRRRLAGRRLGRRLLAFPEVDSTNDVAWQALEAAGSPAAVDGLAVVAGFQSRGRGRRGGTWVAPPGASMLVSVLLAPPSGAHLVAGLTAAGGCAAAEAVRRVSGRAPALEWPNDVLLGARKVAGVLVEARTRPGSGSVYVVGVGLNANGARADYPEALRASLTTLEEETGRPVDLAAVTEAFLGALEDREGALRAGNAKPLETEFARLLGLLGKEVEVGLSEGRVEGRLEGVSFAEGLRVRLPDGERTLPCEGVLSLAAL